MVVALGGLIVGKMSSFFQRWRDGTPSAIVCFGVFVFLFVYGGVMFFLLAAGVGLLCLTPFQLAGCGLELGDGSVVSENQYAPVEWFIGTLPVYVRNAFVWVLVFELLQGNCCAPVALTSGRPTKTHLVSTKLVSELQPEPEPEPEVEPTVAFT